MTRRDVVSIACCLAALVAVTFFKLPPGICYGDSGELQLVSRTLGITHAPGYPVLASLGYLATRILPFDPAYAVTLACYAAGLLVFALLALVQMRLGVPTPISVTVSLAFLWPNRTWMNLLAPEVYTPTLAFLAASVYLLMRYEAKGRRRDLSISAFCFGLALATRPPLLFCLPFILWGWWHARRRWVTRRGAVLRSLGWVAVCGAVPSVYSIGYLYVRDRADTPYDYIELHSTEFHAVPELSEGALAKVHRVFWHLSGQEFSYAFNHEWKHVRQKFRWLRNEFLHGQPVVFGLVLVVMGFGAVVMRRRWPGAFWPTAGFVVGSLVFLCAYKMYGQAADYFPLLWTAFVWFGVGLSPLSTTDWFARSGSAQDRLAEAAPTLSSFLRRVVPLAQRHGGTVAFAVVVAFTFADLPQRPPPSFSGDATEYVRKMEFASLPRGSVLCVAWPDTPVVFYLRYVLAPRADIAVLAASEKNWPRLVQPYSGRPLFAATPVKSVEGYTLEPYRNLWRMTPVDPRGGP